MADQFFSIIVPAFNAERYIGKALESVRSQSYGKWEVIVTNDGATDGAARVVAEFARQVPQSVLLLQHERSQGPSAARNTAMKAAKGEYFAFLDADDVWMPEHLESLCSVLSSGQADLAYSDCYVFREMPSGEIELLPVGALDTRNPQQALFRRNFINTSAAAITRRLMEKVGGFDISLWFGEEWDYWIRAAALNFQIAGTGKQTYYYRKSESSLSAAAAKMAESSGRIYEKHRYCGILPESEIAALASKSYFAAGKLYWREDAAIASRMFYKSWFINRSHFLTLACAAGAAGLSLAQLFRLKGRSGNRLTKDYREENPKSL